MKTPQEPGLKLDPTLLIFHVVVPCLLLPFTFAILVKKSFFPDQTHPKGLEPIIDIDHLAAIEVSQERERFVREGRYQGVRVGFYILGIVISNVGAAGALEVGLRTDECGRYAGKNAGVHDLWMIGRSAQCARHCAGRLLPPSRAKQSLGGCTRLRAGVSRPTQ